MNDMASFPDLPSQDFLGVAFHPIDQSATLQAIFEQASAADFAYVVTPNVDHVVRLHEDADSPLWGCYDNAKLRVCDSQVLQGLAKRSGVHLPLVTGSDLTGVLLDRLNETGGAASVIGGDDAIMADLARIYPRIVWSGHQPPMGVRSNPAAREAICAFVENCPAGVHLFAIGSPQSEMVCAQLLDRGQARGVALCIGASLEFLTGAKSRAPAVMQRWRMEWLYRLGSEPTRLWRRYLVQGPKIFAIWWRWKKGGASRVENLRPHPRGACGSNPSDVS